MNEIIWTFHVLVLQGVLGIPKIPCKHSACGPDANGKWQFFVDVNGVPLRYNKTEEAKTNFGSLKTLKHRTNTGKSGQEDDFQSKTVPNLANDPVYLGQLYSAKTNKLLAASLWNHKTLKENKLILNSEFVTSDYLEQEKYLDRVNDFNLDVELKASFLGGLIEIKGSAHYAHMEELDEKEVSVTLAFRSLGNSEVLPNEVEKDMEEWCDPEKSGATHVVSSITYGLNAYLNFRRKVKDKRHKKEIGGALSIAVQGIPGLKITGSASVNLTEDQNEVAKNAQVTYFGDAIIPAPSSFKDAQRVVTDLYKLAKNPTKVVQYEITPMKMYCSEADVILNKLTEGDLHDVNKMMVDFHETKSMITRLKKTDISQHFTIYSRIFTTLEDKFLHFKNTQEAKLQELLPGIRGNRENKKGLGDLVADYDGSQFKSDYLSVFLGVRKREIETIQFILEKSKETKNIEISYGDEGSSCALNANLGIVIILNVYVLPNSNDIAKDYINAPPGDFDEGHKWFKNINNPDYLLTAATLRKFIDFREQNPGKKCFVVELQKLRQKNASEFAHITALHEGYPEEQNFTPPGKVKNISSNRGYKECSFTLEFEPNRFVNQVEAVYWEDQGEGKEGATIDQKQFFKVSPSVPQAVVTVVDLKPNTNYEFKFFLVTRYGKGPASNTNAESGGFPGKTVKVPTLPSSIPSSLMKEDVSSNSASFSWREPLTIAPGVDIDGYDFQYKSMDEKDGEYFTRKHESGKSANLKELLPATNYIMEVKAISKKGKIIPLSETTTMTVKIESLWAKLAFTTLPMRLEPPGIVNTTENSISLMWQPPNKIAKGSKQLYYEVSYAVYQYPDQKSNRQDKKTGNQTETKESESATTEIADKTVNVGNSTNTLSGNDESTSNGNQTISSQQEEINELFADRKLTQAEKEIKTLTGLSPGVRYKIKIRVRTTKGMTDWSDPVIAKTLDLKLTELDKLKNSLGIPMILAKIAKHHPAGVDCKWSQWSDWKCPDWQYFTWRAGMGWIGPRKAPNKERERKIQVQAKYEGKPCIGKEKEYGEICSLDEMKTRETHKREESASVEYGG